MRRIVFALFITFLSCLNIFAQDNPFDRLVIDPCGNLCIEESGKDYISFYSYSEDKQFVFTVTDEIIQKLEVKDRRITFDEAAEIAENKLKTILVYSENWKQGLLTERVYKETTFFIINFKSTVPKTNDSFRVVVLRNGEAIEPKINNLKN